MRDVNASAAGETATPSFRPSRPPDARDVGAAGSDAWHPGLRLLFRFAFCYIVLYYVPHVLWWLQSLPVLGAVFRIIDRAQDRLALWTETHVFGLPHALPTAPPGSTDTMLWYAALVDTVLLALLGMLAWTLLDRKRLEYRRLHAWLAAFARFTLALIMFNYGFAKIFTAQMPFYLGRLAEPWGNFSPMGVLWSFMSFSTVYQVFAGSLEVLGGLLLCFRRTATLGGLILVVTLTNVVLLNFTFHVPVKIHSSNLLLLAIFLVLPDAGRLLRVALNQSVEPRAIEPLFRRPWMNHVGLAFVPLFLTWATWVTLPGEPYRPPLYGIWNVDDPKSDGVPEPAGVAHSMRLRSITFDVSGSTSVLTTSNASSRYRARVDTLAHSITMTEYGDTIPLRRFVYSQPDSMHLVLSETTVQDSAVVRLRRVDPTEFPLMRGRFHWIQERPFNR